MAIPRTTVLVLMGVTVVSALSVTSLPVFNIYEKWLTAHPVPTRIATATTLALAGDALAQRRELAYSSRRTFALVATESLYRGLMLQPILLWVIAHFHGSLLRSLQPFGISAALAVVLERVLFQTFVVAPIVYYPLYFAITGPLQGLSLKETLHRARTQYGTLFGFNLCFWFPVQTVQFAVVPERFKVPFICLCSVIWNFILSTLSGSVAKFRTVRTESHRRSE